MLRWLLPMLAALTLLGSAGLAWAAAGFVGGDACCCPVKAKCKCHDHDGKPDPTPKLKRCGGDIQKIAPAVTTAVVAAAPEAPCDVRVVRVSTRHRDSIPEPPTFEPETPPF